MNHCFNHILYVLNLNVCVRYFSRMWAVTSWLSPARHMALRCLRTRKLGSTRQGVWGVSHRAPVHGQRLGGAAQAPAHRRGGVGPLQVVLSELYLRQLATSCTLRYVWHSTARQSHRGCWQRSHRGQYGGQQKVRDRNVLNSIFL